MKMPFVSAVWRMFGAVALFPLAVSAQTPFSSTQPPTPFNRSSGLPASSSPAPRAGSQYPLMPNGAVPGAMMMPPVTGPIDADHLLGPRDTLSYRVAEDRDETVQTLQVLDSGEVQLPLGSLRVKASGKTSKQLEADIKSVLEKEYYKPGHATVFVALNSVANGTSKGKVYVFGEVASKGSIDLPVDGHLTVSQLILQLGGFTEDADQKAVYLVRKGGPRKGVRLDIKAVLNGDLAKDVVLQPDDTVRVERKLFGLSM